MGKDVKIRNDLSFCLPETFLPVEEKDYRKYLGSLPVTALFLSEEPACFLAFTERTRSAYGRTEILLKAYQEAFSYYLKDFVLLEAGICEDEMRILSFSFLTKEETAVKYRLFGAVLLKDREVLFLAGCGYEDSLRMIPVFREILESFHKVGECHE